jgi:predicted RNase H-like nuclease (RuvC/YqgF family)
MAEVEELVESAAPKEVIDRVKELIKEGKSMKEALKQAWDEYKKKTEKASEEKDTEIANLKQELDKKNQEIEKAKVEKPEDTQPELVVGDVTQKDTNYYKGKRDSIDKKAFGQIK